MNQKNNTGEQEDRGDKRNAPHVLAVFIPLFFGLLGWRVCALSSAASESRFVFTDVTRASGIIFKLAFSPDRSRGRADGR
jgi:hypothetical protein